ncbi:MAG: DNA polymerase III subunit beta [bacterium]|nr:DNA polymerase III subunit beta [bacterium]
MKITLDKEGFLSKIKIAQEFTANRLTSTQALQGVYLSNEGKELHIYSTDLNSYFHSIIPADEVPTLHAIIEPKKIIEFVQLLDAGDIDITIEKQNVTIQQKKTKGAFPCIIAEDFPQPPQPGEQIEQAETSLISKNLSKLLFAASSDDARPVLTGVNVVSEEGAVVFVTTDGFRLSIVKEKQTGTIPSMIIPADFLRKVSGYIKESKSVTFSFSKKERVVRLSDNQMDFYTSLIDGEFPPYERVLPDSKVTTIVLQKDELIRNTKLISVFARDYSYVVQYDFGDSMLRISPKKEANDENTTTQDVTIEGPPQKVSFNYRYVLDFLNSVDGEEIIIEILRPDAPIVFKSSKDKTYTHIIMPVRTQE